LFGGCFFFPRTYPPQKQFPAHRCRQGRPCVLFSRFHRTLPCHTNSRCASDRAPSAAGNFSALRRHAFRKSTFLPIPTADQHFQALPPLPPRRHPFCHQRRHGGSFFCLSFGFPTFSRRSAFFFPTRGDFATSDLCAYGFFLKNSNSPYSDRHVPPLLSSPPLDNARPILRYMGSDRSAPFESTFVFPPLHACPFFGRGFVVFQRLM